LVEPAWSIFLMGTAGRVARVRDPNREEAMPANNLRIPSISVFLPTVVRNGVKSRTKVWWLAWRDPKTGKRKTQSTGATSKKAAQTIAHRKQMEFACPTPTDPTEQHRDLTWAAFTIRFIRDHAATKSEATADKSDTSLRVFTKLMQPARLRDVDLAMLKQFVARRLAARKSRNTIDSDLRVLRCALRRAADWNLISVVPNFKTLWCGDDNGDRRVIPPADIAAIWAALDDEAIELRQRDRHWWKVMLRTKLFLGARLGEVLGLKWSRIDFAAETLTVHHRTSKSKKSRTYPNVGSLLAMLAEWRDSQKPKPAADDAVFAWGQGYRNLYKDFKRILAHAGLPVDRERRHRLKDFRSTAATQMIQEGEPTMAVRDWLGHCSVAVTERFYANVSKAVVDAAGRRKVV
jgi:integrase